MQTMRETAAQFFARSQQRAIITEDDKCLYVEMDHPERPGVTVLYVFDKNTQALNRMELLV